MIKVFLVEDEIIIRNGIKNSINYGRYNESAGCKDYSDYWQFLELFGIKLYPCPVASFIGRRLYPDCARNSDGL